MICRVGVTTDPEERELYWEARCKSFRNWEILYEGLSRFEAQDLEMEEAEKWGCESHEDNSSSDEDEDEELTWSVYYFEHDGCI